MQSLESRKQLVPVFEILAATIILGTTGVWVKSAALPPQIMAFYRSSIPAVVLFIVIRIRNSKMPKKPNKTILLASLLNCIRIFFFLNGFSYTTIGNVYVATYTWPLFLYITGLITKTEKPDLQNILLLLLAFSGIAVVYSGTNFSFDDKDFVGISSVLLAAIIYSFSVFLLRKEAQTYDRYELPFYQNLVAAFAFIPFLFFYPTPPLKSLMFAGINAVFIGIVGFSLFLSGMSRLKMSRGAHISYFEIVAGIFWGWLLIGEPVEPRTLIGAGIIILSLLLQKRKQVKN